MKKTVMVIPISPGQTLEEAFHEQRLLNGLVLEPSDDCKWGVVEMDDEGNLLPQEVHDAEHG